MKIKYSKNRRLKYYEKKIKDIKKYYKSLNPFRFHIHKGFRKRLDQYFDMLIKYCNNPNKKAKSIKYTLYDYDVIKKSKNAKKYLDIYTNIREEAVLLRRKIYRDENLTIEQKSILIKCFMSLLLHIAAVQRNVKKLIK